MTEQEAIAELGNIFPGAKFEIRHTAANRVRVFMNGRAVTVRDRLEQCVAVGRWFANWQAGKSSALQELKDEMTNLNIEGRASGN